jgi:hypothetical protein
MTQPKSIFLQRFFALFLMIVAASPGTEAQRLEEQIGRIEAAFVALWGINQRSKAANDIPLN